MLADSFGKTIGQSGYNGSVDLNEDGAIGFDDFFIFADEFGKDPVCHDTVCTAVYEPVCGRDGITYSNRCKADRAGATVLYSGACGSEVCRPGYLKCADGSCKTSC
ncbi:MAG: hypothetical protein CMH64_00760 [Nanoarchaeota archaeon]|nr:hypothetical protein [Nanoarchaeota archaeon]